MAAGRPQALGSWLDETEGHALKQILKVRKSNSISGEYENKNWAKSPAPLHPLQPDVFGLQYIISKQKTQILYPQNTGIS